MPPDEPMLSPKVIRAFIALVVAVEHDASREVADGVVRLLTALIDARGTSGARRDEALRRAVLRV